MKHNSDCNRQLKPESLMMSYGYKTRLSEGAAKCPIFQTSTFVFNSAEEGKAFFELAYGLRPQKDNEENGLIYGRLNNPNLEILEDRLCLWDGAENCAVFASGMSAISTAMLAFLNPGDLLLYTKPLYGGTDHLINHFLPRFGIKVVGFTSEQDFDELITMINDTGYSHKLRFIFVETPANPTNELFDISLCKKIADHFSTDEQRVLVAVDNTYLGPLWQNPLKFGADLVLYSATKYIGGHSDVIAGACLGPESLIQPIKHLRTLIGSMASPLTCWLLMRSLETLTLRMERQAKNAIKVAEFLAHHKRVEKVNYLGLLTSSANAQYELFKKQCLSPGAMLSFNVVGGEKEAFVFLNNLKIIHLAVSLGGTESLAQHPATMTHAGVDPSERKKLAIVDNMIRLSVGLENCDDIIWDIEQALG